MITYDNIAAMRLNRYAFDLSSQLNNVNKQIKTHSTINQGSDGPAVFNMVSRTQSSQNFYTTAKENAQSGIAMIDIANESISTMQGYLKDIKNLLTQATTASSSDRAVIQNDINELVYKIYTTKHETGFNGLQIFEKASVTSAAAAGSAEEGSEVNENTETSKFINPVEHMTDEELEDEGYIVIHTAEELNTLLRSDLDEWYALGSDIDMSGIDWTPVGNDISRFRGEFNGNGYTISNLRINAPDSTNTVGMFGTIAGASIYNLGLENVTINGNDSVGAIAGHALGSTIDNVYVTGSVTGDERVGGLVGHLYDTEVLSSYTEMSNIQGTSEVGGLFGYAYDCSNIDKVYSSSTISGTNDIGGIAGLADTVSISNAYSSGNISGVERIGGITGTNIATSISYTYTNAAISGSSKVGAMVGYFNGNSPNNSINNSFYDKNRTGLNTGVGYRSADASPSQYAGMVQSTTAAMTNPQTFISNGWDQSVWILNDLDYPQLRATAMPTPEDEPDYFGPLKKVNGPIRVQTGNDNTMASFVNVDTAFTFNNTLSFDVSNASLIEQSLANLNNANSILSEKSYSLNLDKIKLNSQLRSRTNYETQYGDTVNALSFISQEDAEDRKNEILSQLTNVKALRSAASNLNAQICQSLLFGSLNRGSSFNPMELLLS